MPDPRSRAVAALLDRVAGLSTPVLICGETGVGKDYWIAYLFARSGLPNLVDLGCGDVPDTLLESEWFGYRKGAFSGADHDFPGRFLAAGIGMICLSQIDVLPLPLQAKLLRVLERRRFYPLGGTAEVELPARFVFTAASDLPALVREGDFRGDLYYRISTFTVTVPPLHERPADIRALLDFFARRAGVEVRLGGEELAVLVEYRWPGNVRELENFVRAAALRRGVIDGAEVQRLLAESGRFVEHVQRAEWTLAEMERRYIAHLLAKYRNKSRVARILGISRKSLYNKLNRHEDH